MAAPGKSEKPARTRPRSHPNSLTCSLRRTQRARPGILRRMNPAAPATFPQRLRPGPGPDRAGGSIWWLAAVAAAFSLSQLLFVSPRMGLGWDETVYVSQFSAHAPAAFFDAARARGVPLLVAPVTLVTSSAVALRGYLALASGLGLFAALWAWRRLRPAWVLALAGLAFGGLWVSQYYGPQAMPDEWVALSGLAAVGFFLQAATGRGGPGALAGLTVSVALSALFRPGDAVFLAVPLALAVVIVRAWRRWPLLACLVGGMLAGSAPVRLSENCLRTSGRFVERRTGSRTRLPLPRGVVQCRTLNWRAPTGCRTTTAQPVSGGYI